MLFMGKQNSDPTQPKQRSMLGNLFRPDFGADIRPLGQAGAAFVNLIAMIFAMNGLFPKNHPALTGVEGARLSLSLVLRTAWNDLSFTKEGIPKIVLFFSVAGAILFSILAILTIFMLMFVGNAHAQTTASTGCSSSSFFAPCSTDDLAQGMMDFLFKGKDLPDYVTQGTGSLSGQSNGSPISQYTGIQTAFISTLAFYSDAVLIFAAIILFYHLVSMVVETAHHGVPMGKRASQIWAPIRLVVAIGLLVPISSAGLNTGQYIVIQMASWGSGLASQVWSHFVNSFAQNSFVAPPAERVDQFAANILEIEACKLIVNRNANLVGQSIDVSSMETIQPVTVPNPSPGFDSETIFTPNSSADSGAESPVCGGYSYTAPTVGPTSGSGTYLTNLANNVLQAQQTALTQALSKAETDVNDALSNCSGNTPCFSNSGQPQPAYKDIIGDIANTYETTVDNSVSSVIKSNLAGEQETTDWTSLGWMAAGAYLNRIARTQAGIEIAVKAGFPKFTAPAPDKLTDEDQAEYLAFTNWAKTGLVRASPLYGSNAGPDTVRQGCPNIAWTTFGRIVSGIANPKDWVKDITNFGIIKILFRVADEEACSNGVWQQYNVLLPSGGLGIQITQGDPLAALARLGHANLDTAYRLIDKAVNLEVGTEVTSAGLNYGKSFFGTRAKSILDPIVGVGTAVASGTVRIIISVMSFLALIFFSTGFLLAYFVPLIPFIRFFFNVIIWIAMVLEGIVMMPLVALAHLNPEGEGLPGTSAKTAYFFIFNIMLRPVLMIFGLVAAILVFVTAVIFMNKLYGLAVVEVADMAHSGEAFSAHFIYSLIYTILVYMAANNCFKLIHSFPDHAMAWMGSQATPKESLGEAEHLGQTMGTVSTLAGQQLFSNLSQGAEKFGGQVKSGANTAITNRESAKSSATAQRRHGANLRAQRGLPPAPGDEE